MNQKINDIAIVLKAHEIIANDQFKVYKKITFNYNNLLHQYQNEAQKWNKLRKVLAPNYKSNFQFSKTDTQLSSKSNLSNDDWAKILKESKEILKKNKVEEKDVIQKYNTGLKYRDITASIFIGIIGALVPSIKIQGNYSIVEGCDYIEELADKHKLPSILKSIFGDGQPANYMDSGPGGAYHRFSGGHDLCEEVFKVMFKGAGENGYIIGLKEVFQHLLRDSFGKTGIPIPGSTVFINFLNDKISTEGVSSFISKGELSKYAGFRMSDIGASGIVSLLLFAYRKIYQIPSNSINSSKLSILAHGICASAIALASVAGLPMPTIAQRSHINYISLTAMGYNTFQLYLQLNQLKLKNRKEF